MSNPLNPSRPQQQRPLRPNSAEARAARYANRPPAPAAIFIAPPLVEDKIAQQHDRGPDRAPKSKSDTLRMTKSASDAARRSNLTDQQIRAVLEDPTQVGPDRDNPERTRFVKGSLVVVTGKDGIVLGVYKR